MAGRAHVAVLINKSEAESLSNIDGIRMRRRKAGTPGPLGPGYRSEATVSFF